MTESASGERENEAPPAAVVAALERTVDRFSGWVQFGDAKAAGVLVLLGLALTDLLGQAGALADANRLPTTWGDVATVSLYGALALAVLVVLQASRALFPRVKPTAASVFFFGSVAKYESGKAYSAAFVRLSPEQVADELAEQAWELARIASQKFERLRLAYWLVLAFLTAWATARMALGLAV